MKTMPGLRAIVVPDFFAGAAALRQAFERRFARPFATSRERFVWDYWYVPGQYTYLRTFASSFFPAQHYDAFMERLSTWGRDTIRCPKPLAPWLSYYVEGCTQERHVDTRHGPWAYVYSLTDWKRRGFSGGETFLTQPDGSRVHIAPEANQLVVFDPLIPHGVETVRGTQDPIDARIVLHGWFTPQSADE